LASNTGEEKKDGEKTDTKGNETTKGDTKSNKTESTYVADVGVEMKVKLPNTLKIADIAKALTDRTGAAGAYVDAAEAAFASAAGVDKKIVKLTKFEAVAASRRARALTTTALAVKAVFKVTFAKGATATSVNDMVKKTSGTDNTFAADFATAQTAEFAKSDDLKDLCKDGACDTVVDKVDAPKVSNAGTTVTLADLEKDATAETTSAPTTNSTTAATPAASSAVVVAPAMMSIFAAVAALF